MADVSVGRSELKLVLWSYVVLAGAATIPVRELLDRLVSFEVATGVAVLVTGLALYPVWRLWQSARSIRVSFVSWMASVAMGGLIAFALAWISRPLR